MFADREPLVEEDVAPRAAALRIPDPAPFRHALIRGTVLRPRMTVVARDGKDFACFEGLDVVNP